MTKSIWSGAISFGLVNVPVKLYSAVSKKADRVHQLHDKDGVGTHQTRFRPADDEIVPADNFDEPTADDAETTKREVDMARQLVDSLSTDWEPDKYHDTYRERVLELIEKKADGQEIVLQPVEEPKEVPDLMAALEASVKAAKGRGDGAKAGSGGRKRGAENGDGAKKKPASRSRAKT